MADTYIGANTLLGIGTEAVEGQPVQVQGLLDYSSGTITRDLKVLYSKSLRRTAASRIKKAPGIASYAGDFTLDVTPEGISKMLCATFGAPVTASRTGNIQEVNGAAATNVTYTQTNFPSPGAGGAALYQNGAFAAAMNAAASGGPFSFNGLTAVCSTSYTSSTGSLMTAANATLSGTGFQVVVGIGNGQAVVSPVFDMLPNAAAGGYTSTWTNSFSQIPQTMIQQIGQTIKVFAGCRGSSFKLSVDKEQDSIIQAMFGVMALNEYIYADPAIVGITGAGYDPLPPLSSPMATLSIGGAVTALAKNFEVNCNKNLGTRNVLNGYRGPVSHFTQVSDVTGTMSLFFNDESSLKQYFGQAQSVVAPYAANMSVLSTPVTLAIAQSSLYELDVVFPSCVYDKVGEPVQGQNEIMQEVALSPLFDPTTGTDMLVVLKNTQSGAVITTPGTLIASVPASGVQPYHNP